MVEMGSVENESIIEVYKEKKQCGGGGDH